MSNIKNSESPNGEKIEVKIRHVDRKIWNLVKSILESEYGTYYAHLGDFITQALRHYIEYVLGIDPDNPSLKHGSPQKTEQNPIRTRRKYIISKICRELLSLDEDIPISAKGLREIIQEVIEEATNFPPARSTVYNYFDYLKSSGAFVRNPYTNEYRVCHAKLREILKRLGMD